MDVLPAVSARAKDVYVQIFRLDVDVDLFGFGQHRHGCGRRVNAPAGFGYGDALNAMAAAFVLEAAVRPTPAQLKHNLFDCAQPRLVHIDDFRMPAVALSVARVHPIQIRREQARLVAPGARAYL